MDSEEVITPEDRLLAMFHLGFISYTTFVEMLDEIGKEFTVGGEIVDKKKKNRWGILDL